MGPLGSALALGLLHHRFHGPPIDYAGLAAAAAASWIGLPGPGEQVLIAAGVFAAKHRLDIGEVLIVSWLAATAGGVAGWLIGMKAGRVVLTTRGPLHRTRLKALERGEEVFGRWTVTAILLSPSWVAGILRARPMIYNLTNAVSAAVWALGIGLGAYFVGPDILELANDLGLVTVAGLVLLVLAGVWFEVSRRRRRARRQAAASKT
jgi:membrane protein DedA with SNARE-associated domain